MQKLLKSGVSVNSKLRKERKGKRKEKEKEKEVWEESVEVKSEPWVVSGVCPLHCAAAGGRGEVVDLLLKQKGFFSCFGCCSCCCSCYFPCHIFVSLLSLLFFLSVL